jgi:hypothetical protein
VIPIKTNGAMVSSVSYPRYPAVCVSSNIPYKGIKMYPRLVCFRRLTRGWLWFPQAFRCLALALSGERCTRPATASKKGQELKYCR